MTSNDTTMIGLQISRSDVAFIHDVLMASAFSGAQLLQAAGIISGLKPALAPPVAAPAAPPESAAPAPKELLRDVPPVPAPVAPRALSGGKRRKR